VTQVEPGVFEAAAVNLLPKVIAEKAEPVDAESKRDEDADKHPQPKSNAGIGVLRPAEGGEIGLP
jgi:hypothetical protein